jgi:hypothetical protein
MYLYLDGHHPHDLGYIHKKAQLHQIL